MRNIRGEITVAVIAIVALLGAGAWIGSKLFSKDSGSSKDTPIEEIQIIQKKKDDSLYKFDSSISIQNSVQLDTAQAGVHATGEAINQAERKILLGEDAQREIETARDINDITKKAIDLGLDKPVDPKLLAWFIETINQKNSEIERERQFGERMLSSKDRELIASQEREKKLIDERARSEEKFNEKLAEKTEELNEWALKNSVKAAKYDKILLWVFIVVGLYMFALISPLLARVFPALGPIASVAGGIVAPAVQWTKKKSDRLAEDLVALQEDTKKYIEKIDPEKIDQYKSHVKQWWENDTSAQSDVEEIKKKLRV